MKWFPWGMLQEVFFSWLFSMGSKQLTFRTLWEPRVFEEVLYNGWTWIIFNSVTVFIRVFTFLFVLSSQINSDAILFWWWWQSCLEKKNILEEKVLLDVSWCPNLSDFINLTYHALNKKQQAWKQISLAECFLMQQLPRTPKQKTPLHCSFFCDTKKGVLRHLKHMSHQ